MTNRRYQLCSLATALLGLGWGCSAWATDTTDHLATLPDGRRLHIACRGSGAPTVILESGLGLPMVAWSKVQDQLASRLRVCAYDRAGYGKSDPGPMPRDAKHVATDLHDLARAEGLASPYILVGHSLGAQFVRLFADRYRAEVSGIVLIDPHFDDKVLALVSPAAAALLANDKLTTKRCIGALAKGVSWRADDASYTACGPPPPPNVLLGGRNMAKASLSEFENIEADAAQVQATTRHRIDIPMIVLTAKGKRPAPLAEVQDLIAQQHAEIASTSSRGLTRVVNDSGHVIQFDRPNAVVEAVDDLVALTSRKPE